MPPGHAYLFLDQVEVVEEPFSGRRDPAIGRHRRREQIAGFEEDALVCSQP
jgi:hypothetical protein